MIKSIVVGLALLVSGSAFAGDIVIAPGTSVQLGWVTVSCSGARSQPQSTVLSCTCDWSMGRYSITMTLLNANGQTSRVRIGDFDDAEECGANLQATPRCH